MPLLLSYYYSRSSLGMVIMGLWCMDNYIEPNDRDLYLHDNCEQIEDAYNDNYLRQLYNRCLYIDMDSVQKSEWVCYCPG